MAANSRTLPVIMFLTTASDDHRSPKSDPLITTKVGHSRNSSADLDLHDLHIRLLAMPMLYTKLVELTVFHEKSNYNIQINVE